jgi:hypothetical protein
LHVNGGDDECDSDESSCDEDNKIDDGTAAGAA